MKYDLLYTFYCSSFRLFTKQDSPAVSLSVASVGHHSHTPEAEIKHKVCQKIVSVYQLYNMNSGKHW